MIQIAYAVAEPSRLHESDDHSLLERGCTPAEMEWLLSIAIRIGSYITLVTAKRRKRRHINFGPLAECPWGYWGFVENSIHVLGYFENKLYLEAGPQIEKVWHEKLAGLGIQLASSDQHRS